MLPLSAAGLGQPDDQATVGNGTGRLLVDTGGQGNLSLEAPLRQLDTVNDGGAKFGRQDTLTRDQQHAVVDDELHLVGVDARQGDENQHGIVGFEDIDGRLPGDSGTPRRTRG